MSRQRRLIPLGILVLAAGLAISAGAQQEQPPVQPVPARPEETYKPSQGVDKTYRPSHDARPIVLVPSDWLEDSSVRGTNDEKLGDVKDLLVARRQGRVTFALVGRGGVLNIGEKVVAVPFRSMSWDQGRKCLILPMTEERFKAAPLLDTGEWKTLGEPSRTEPIYSFFNTPDERGEPDEQPAVRPDEPPRLGADEFPVLRMSDIKGKALVGSDGREVGKVDDLVLDTGSGRLAFVAVTFGSVLGIGAERVAVPWPAFDVNKDGRLFVTSIDKETIRSAPKLTEKDWGELKDPAYGTRVYKHFGRSAAWLDRDLAPAARAPGDPQKADRGYERMCADGTPRDVSGTITSVEERTAMDGAPRVVVLTVKINADETVTVHTCPKSYLDENRVQFKTGDTVVVKGREALLDGRRFVIATQITPANGQPLTVRRDDGTAGWR